MDFLELARARYSCRKLTNAPVAAEKLERILEAARVAPTAKNLQPYRLFLLESPEAVAKVHEITPCIFGADCFLMVAAVPSEGWVREFDRKNFAEIDAAIVATHIMLAIEAEGLGSTCDGAVRTDCALPDRGKGSGSASGPSPREARAAFGAFGAALR